MIRLIKRRLIIPQGDTGTFTIPTQGFVSQGDLAVLTIMDPLTRTILLEKRIDATEETLTFKFNHADTIDIEPSNKYLWDITIYRAPVLDESGKITDAEDIDSYYGAFKLPICEIRGVPRVL